MTSQLRQYMPSAQSGISLPNAQHKNQEEMQADGGKEELLVKQPYWEYDDFMNSTMRPSPKKCYYERMPRDEYNCRLDLSKDLENRRNQMVNKMKRDSLGSLGPSSVQNNEVRSQYGAVDSQNILYSTPTPGSLPEISQKTSQHSISIQPQCALSQQKNSINTSTESENFNSQSRPNQNPRPRCLPHHMRSNMNFQPRPGPGVFKSMNLSTDTSTTHPTYRKQPIQPPSNRMKPQYKSQTSVASSQQDKETFTSFNNDHEDSVNIGKGDNRGDNSNESIQITNEKYYDSPNVQPKTDKQYPSRPLMRNTVPSHSFPSTHSSSRYQQQQMYINPALQEVQRPPVLSQYELSQQSQDYPQSKLNCNLNECNSSCSCSSENNKSMKNPNTNYQTQNVPSRTDIERQFRASPLENAQAQQQSQYSLKRDPAERSQAPMARVQYDSSHYMTKPQTMQRGSPTQQYESGHMNDQRSHYAVPPSSAHSCGSNMTAMNMKPIRPNKSGTMPSPNYQYPPQSQPSRNTKQPVNSLQPPVSSAQPVNTPQIKRKLQHNQQQYNYQANEHLQQPCQQKPQQACVRNPSVPPSEPVSTNINNNIPPVSEDYDEFFSEFERNSNKQVVVTKPPQKSRNQMPMKYNTWSPPQVQCDNGDAWNNTMQDEYCYTDSDNGDIEECEDEEDDNSW